MRSFAALALVVAGCSAAASSGRSSSQWQGVGDQEPGLQEGGAQDAGTCRYPAGVAADTDVSAPGCFARTPGRICQVSNGATVLLDGGVSGGTESCQPLCGASQYEMMCRGAGVLGAIPDPPSSIGCTIIPIPTPSNVLFHCCPCAE